MFASVRAVTSTVTLCSCLVCLKMRLMQQNRWLSEIHAAIWEGKSACPIEKIVLHQHTSAYNTFVVKGEHRIYTPEGELTEVRPAGTYKAGVASEEPHTEGGRDEDVVILFSLRPYNAETPIYEILDDNRDVAATMNFNGLKELHESKAA